MKSKYLNTDRDLSTTLEVTRVLPRPQKALSRKQKRKMSFRLKRSGMEKSLQYKGESGAEDILCIYVDQQNTFDIIHRCDK